MTNTCQQCEQTYEAATARSRYCSNKCRRRHNYTGAARRADSQHTRAGTIANTTQGYLADINMAGTPRGLALLVLAERLDKADTMSDAGLAAVQRQYDATLDRIAQDYSRVTQDDDPIAQIKAQRAKRFAELRVISAERRAHIKG